MPSAPTDLRGLSRSSTPTSTQAGSMSSVPGSVPPPRSRWATRVLLPFVIVIAACAVLLYAARDALRPAIEVYVTPVIPKVVAVAQTAGSSENASSELGAVLVQAPGWVEPAPYAISVPALAEGVVKEVLVLEGHTVTAGQVVVRLIDDDVRLQLRTAEAVLNERRADIERAEAAVVTAQAQVAVEQSAVVELRDEVTRKRELVKSGSVSIGEFRRLEIREAGLQARAATAERAVDEARAALKQAQSELATAGVSRDEVQLNLDRMEIRSPAAGVVLSRYVEPGSRISMGGRGGEGTVSGPAGGMSGLVLRLYDPAKLQVRVDVPLADAAKVSVGTRAVLSTEAVPDTTFSGVVTRIIHEANIQRNTVQFKVSIEKPSPVLKPEMLTRVKLHGTAAKNSSLGSIETTDGATLLIAASAVLEGAGSERFVWLVETGSRSTTARKTTVKVAPSGDATFVTVSEGLRLSDRVVINPPATLRERSRIKVLGERQGELHSSPSSPIH